MGSQNVLDPLCGCVGSCGCGTNGFHATHTMLIERLIGNAYEVVKFVACNMDKIQQASDLLNSSQSLESSINIVLCNDHSVFNLSLSSVQEMTLTKNVTSSEISTSTTNLSVIVMRFIQDAIGGRVFTWPDSFISHGDISLAPNAISQQIFAKNSDGTYDYTNPMMYPRS